MPSLQQTINSDMKSMRSLPNTLVSFAPIPDSISSALLITHYCSSPFPSLPHYSPLITVLPYSLFEPHSFQNEYSTLTTAYPSVFQPQIPPPPHIPVNFPKKHSFRLDFFYYNKRKTNTQWALTRSAFCADAY
jgi:hypothetical protein